MNKQIKKLGWDEINGTSLKGYIEATYEELFNILGDAENGNEEKVAFEWRFEFEGEIISIYSWKVYVNEFNESEIINTISEWHIGGKSSEAVLKVMKLFPNNTITFYD